jgi:hypothetical protein
VLVLRWCLDGTRLALLAADHRIGRSTAYRYLHKGIDVLAAAAPGLRGALLAARAAGHAHVHVSGTLIRTDRCSVLGPTVRRGREVNEIAGAAEDAGRLHPKSTGPMRIVLGSTPASAAARMWRDEAHLGFAPMKGQRTSC